MTIEELDAIQTWQVLVARRPRFERHHAVAIADDALKAAIVLTDRFVPERARPDKAIDVLDEACAHAQATAQVSPDLDRLIRERRKIEALIKRGLTEEHPSDQPTPDLGAVLDQVVADFREMMGGPSAPPAPAAAVAQPRPSTLEERRAELDRLLHEELERQGIVVSGKDVARVVAAAVGKGIEWAG